MRGFRRHVGRSVTVQIGDGESITGTLVSDADDTLTFEGATLHAGAEPIELDGDVIVPVSRVRWAQVV